ncbi:MAG: hypothetical protein HS111_34610 [Kofleriaceae bacterium]|nr:hypothetical protein [Kofleriaceae bacterium]MCL4225092.1 hypothetical protein [Myxococcales bacterium]
MNRGPRTLALVVGLVALAAACRGETPNEERKLPQLQPGPFHVPERLALPLVIDGQAAGAIDAARLRARPADFRDAERHAWRLDTLLAPELGGRAARISGKQPAGASLVVEVPGKELVPVLLVNRRGQALLTLVDPADPFPRFHGQGGRMARPGQRHPQVAIDGLAIELLPASP